MSGNNVPADPSVLDLLGRLTADPIPALERIVEKPCVGSGLLIVSLTVLGQMPASTLALTDGAVAVVKQAGGHFIGQLLKWAGPVVLLHFFSVMSGKKGSLGSFLALTGWSFVVFWPGLALRLFATGATPWTFYLSLLLATLFNTLFLAMGWWGLQRVYGWTKIQSVFVLLATGVVLGLVQFFSNGS